MKNTLFSCNGQDCLLGECPQALSLLSRASECRALSCREAASPVTTAFLPKPDSSRLENHHLAPGPWENDRCLLGK